jgi:hypothetical protein
MSYQRKQWLLSPYEYDGTPTEASYVYFQTKLANSIRMQIAHMPCVFVDGTADSDQLLLKTENAVNDLLAGASRRCR